jgi:hypothetical protein
MWMDIMILGDGDDYSYQMEQIKEQYPGSRVRVIDDAGRVLDSI